MISAKSSLIIGLSLKKYNKTPLTTVKPVAIIKNTNCEMNSSKKAEIKNPLRAATVKLV